MSARAFGVFTPRELLTRARYEIGELEGTINVYYLSEQEGKHKVGSLAGTCAGTLWNVVDWLANSSDPKTKSALARAGFASHAIIRDHVKANSSALTLCWEITNGYKHCELTGYIKETGGQVLQSHIAVKKKTLRT